MASTFTPNIQLEEPARGDQVGVWDTPVNSNMTLVDRILGGITTIGLNNSPVVLSAAQFQSRQITFNSTLTGSVAITFPTSFTKSYEIQNLCTGSSAFTITLATTAAGGQVICCPPGETVDCFNDGSNIKFKNLGRVGSYWDHGGSSVPAWVSGCSVPPYLNCDGSVFSPATYPQLAMFLGGTTLPDSRGRFRAAMNQGTARLNAANSIDGNTRGAAGGSELLQSHAHANSLNDPGHLHSVGAMNVSGLNNNNGGGGGVFAAGSAQIPNTGSATTGMTITNASAGGGNSQNVPPAYVGGLTLIRAA